MMTRVRWWILTLLFLATTINYLDRILFSVLAKEIKADLSLSTEAYGNLLSAFEFAYMIGFIFAGKLIDKFGTKIGFGVAVVWWSLAAMMHAFASTPVMFGFWRAMLGLGEAGNFPSAIKAVSEWFPVRDRAFAVGIFNAGTNVASMIGPPMFVYAAAQYGWRACFVVTGAIGFVWLVAWLLFFRQPAQHPGVNVAELKYIEADREPQVASAKMSQVIGLRQTWGFSLAKFFSDPVWRFYLYWLPLYLRDEQKLSPTTMAWTITFVYLMADFGSVLGGWLSGYFLRRGWSVARARTTTLLICALCMPISSLAVFAPNAWLAVLLVSVATSAHQAYSANLFATATDVFPRNAMATVTGIGGATGSLGSTLIAGFLISRVVASVGYVPVFVTMGFMHLIGWLVLSRLLGRFERAELKTA